MTLPNPQPTDVSNHYSPRNTKQTYSEADSGFLIVKEHRPEFP